MALSPELHWDFLSEQLSLKDSNSSTAQKHGKKKKQKKKKKKEQYCNSNITKRNETRYRNTLKIY
jgi:hypothetical protein